MKKQFLSLFLAGVLLAGMAMPAAAEEREETTISAFVMQSVTGESGIWEGFGAQKLYEDLKIRIDFDPTGNEV